MKTPENCQIAWPLIEQGFPEDEYQDFGIKKTLEKHGL